MEAANRLVAYNAQRTTAKEPLLAGKTHLKYPEPEHLQLRVFKTDDEEATSIAAEISALGSGLWRRTTVLARTRAHLERMHAALDECQVPCVIAQRRDDFLSAEFRWLTALLRQVVRPLDRRNMAAVVDSFNRMADQNIAVDQVITDAETTGRGYLATWLQTANDIDASRGDLLDLVGPFTTDSSAGKSAIDAILEAFAGAPREADADSDLVEDMSAWRDLARDIARHIGRNAPLDQFLQQLELRSKEPTPKPDTVTLMTIHAAKGKEFDCVYLIGLAEDIMPSYQSRKKGNHSHEMEEERRNCFVAITRTRERLVLSRAMRYRGWNKQLSRFLVEMELATEG